MPDSPMSKTRASERAAMEACSTARRNAGLDPIIFGEVPTSSRSRSFSRCRLACSSAFLSATSTFSRLSGFSRKSNAPARVASTASAIVPCPEIMMAGARLALCCTERRRSIPLPSGRRMSNRNASARDASPFFSKLGHRPADGNGVALALQDHAQGAADVVFVINNQNFFRRHVSYWEVQDGTRRRRVHR